MSPTGISISSRSWSASPTPTISRAGSSTRIPGRDADYIFSTDVVISAREAADVGKLASSKQWDGDRSRRQGAGLDRRLFQHPRRAVPALEGRGVSGRFRPSPDGRSGAAQSRGSSTSVDHRSWTSLSLHPRTRYGTPRSDPTARPASPPAAQSPSRPRPGATGPGGRR